MKETVRTRGLRPRGAVRACRRDKCPVRPSCRQQSHTRPAHKATNFTVNMVVKFEEINS